MFLRLLSLFVFAMLLAHVGQAQSDVQMGTTWGTGEINCHKIVDEMSPEQKLDPSYARARAWEEKVFGADHPCRKDVVLEEFDPGTWKRTSPIEATDDAGKSSDIRLYVLDDRFSWKFDSAKNLQDGSEDVRIRNIFERPLFLNELCAADAAIAIGAASHEGSAEYNAVLAGNRAKYVTEQLATVGNLCEDATGPPLYLVNMGEYREEASCTLADCRISTAAQRGLVIVAAENSSNGIDFKSAINAGLNSPQLGTVFSAEDYSMFEVFELSGS